MPRVCRERKIAAPPVDQASSWLRMAHGESTATFGLARNFDAEIYQTRCRSPPATSSRWRRKALRREHFHRVIRIMIRSGAPLEGPDQRALRHRGIAVRSDLQDEHPDANKISNETGTLSMAKRASRTPRPSSSSHGPNANSTGSHRSSKHRCSHITRARCSERSRPRRRQGRRPVPGEMNKVRSASEPARGPIVATRRSC